MVALEFRTGLADVQKNFAHITVIKSTNGRNIFRATDFKCRNFRSASGRQPSAQNCTGLGERCSACGSPGFDGIVHHAAISVRRVTR
jgi:hypothetical protein